MTTPEQPEQIDWENAMTKASETLIATLIHMAECKDMGRGPAPDCPLRKAAAEITRLSAENERLRGALEWYAVKVADCRKASSEGVEACRKLDADGGSFALAALNGERHD